MNNWTSIYSHMQLGGSWKTWVHYLWPHAFIHVPYKHYHFLLLCDMKMASSPVKKPLKHSGKGPVMRSMHRVYGSIHSTYITHTDIGMERRDEDQESSGRRRYLSEWGEERWEAHSSIWKRTQISWQTSGSAGWWCLSPNWENMKKNRFEGKDEVSVSHFFLPSHNIPVQWCNWSVL